MSGRVVGGLLMRVRGTLFPTSVRLELAPAPACWRCGARLYLSSAELVPGDDEHPWIWCCGSCVTDVDRLATGGLAEHVDDPDPRA